MKKFLSLVLALVMTASLVTVSAGAKEFKDDKDVTYDEAVAVISEIGVVDGDTDGNFRPTDNLSRGAAAKIICNLILGPTTAAELKADTAPYKDVAVNNPFAGYIAYCAKEEIISGYADGSFRPAGTLTGYAFMKMLLGALGYDGSYEGYTGANWSINVAKQAIGIGLNKGLTEEFNGVDFVTREEAALYAFNTLQATLVSYDQKITTNVNGVDVTITQGAAKPVDWAEGINKDGNIKDDKFVQFAEEYFPKLVRGDDYTKFMEPANVWTYDKTDIGTYERKDLIVESYTTEVTGRDLYDLLKAGVIKENDLEVYVDGVAATGDELFDKGDMVRSNTTGLGATDNGVVTKVYLNTDKKLVTVASINTWLAKATADYSESKEYAPLTVYTDVAKSPTYNVDVEEVSNVVDVKKDAFYQVNISKKGNANGEVVVLKDVEILEDSTVTKFSTDNTTVTKLTVGGEEYKKNVKTFYDKDILNKYNDGLLTDNTYNIYVDANGYFIGVDLFEGTKNYVFITGFDRNTSNLSVKTATASAIFLDGTMKNVQVNVTATDKNIEKLGASEDNEEYFVKWSETGEATWTAAGKQYEKGVYNLNQWYTYTETDGVYTLKPCARMTWTKYPATPDVSIRTDKLSLNDSQGNKTRVYGEDNTVFLTVDLDVVDTTNGNKKAITEVTGVYTGIQNVDIDVDVKDLQAVAEGQVYTVYDSDGYVIAAVVIGEARGATANYAYIISNTKSEAREDGMYRWTFDAVLGGVKQTLTAKSKYENTMDNLKPGTIQELRFDGDYVAAVKDLDNSKIYKNFTVDNVKDFDVYVMEGKDSSDPSTDKADTLVMSTRTMYVTEGRRDVGLYIAPDAKAVTIQNENKETDVVTNFDDVSSAIAHLADADPDTTKFEFDGKIYAALNDDGDAAWVVFVNNATLSTGANDNQGSGSGKLYDYKYSVTPWGQANASLIYNRPAYVPANAAVQYSFDVYADGVWIDTDSGVLTDNAARWNDSTTPGAKIELRNVKLTPASVYVEYYINGTKVEVGTGKDLTAGDATLKTIYGATTGMTLTNQSGTFTVNNAIWEDTGDTATGKVTGLVDKNGTVIDSKATGTVNVGGTATTYGTNTTDDVYAKGDSAVKVELKDLDKKAVQYKVSSDQDDIFNGTGYAISNFKDKNGSTVPNNGDTKILKITLTGATYDTGVATQPNVNFKVEVDGLKTGLYAYEVSVKIDGKTYTKVLTDTNKSASLTTLKLDKNIVINAADITVTPVANTALKSASYNKDTLELTLTFSNSINAATVKSDNMTGTTVTLDPNVAPVVAGNTVVLKLLNAPTTGQVVKFTAGLKAVDGNPFDAADWAKFTVGADTTVAVVNS